MKAGIHYLSFLRSRRKAACPPTGGDAPSGAKQESKIWISDIRLLTNSGMTFCNIYINTIREWKLDTEKQDI
jgi:hypothetical protein